MAINSRVNKATHKYGVEVPCILNDAKDLDKASNNTFWVDAIKKKMYEVLVAFEIRWVKDNHNTPDLDIYTYAGVLSRDSVKISFANAALNNLHVTSADIRNAYQQAPFTSSSFPTI